MSWKSWPSRIRFSLSALLLGIGGCDPAQNPNEVDAANGGNAPPSITSKEGPNAGGSRAIHGIMKQLDDRHPGGLTKAVKDGLGTTTPDWAQLQKDSARYLELTSELAKYDPPRGSRESWTEQCTAFHETAADLLKAVESKKKAEAVAAADGLSNSCMQCHREHRRMRGGGRGPQGGGPPPGGPPPGGPPEPRPQG